MLNFLYLSRYTTPKMLTKNKIKYLKSLLLKKYRLQERKFVVEGDKIVRELIQSSFQIEAIYASKDWVAENSDATEAIASIVFESDPKALKSASAMTTASEVIALVSMPGIDAIKLDPSIDFHCYLDGIRDPGNMGTLIRTASWFGVKQIICSPDCVDLYNSKVLQSSMGAFLHTQVISIDFVSMTNTLISHKVVGATLSGESMIGFKKPTNMVLVIGNEGKGINPKHLELCDQEITIPKGEGSKIESLNAAISGAILMSHLHQ